MHLKKYIRNKTTHFYSDTYMTQATMKLKEVFRSVYSNMTLWEGTVAMEGAVCVAPFLTCTTKAHKTGNCTETPP